MVQNDEPRCFSYIKALPNPSLSGSPNPNANVVALCTNRQKGLHQLPLQQIHLVLQELENDRMPAHHVSRLTDDAHYCILPLHGFYKEVFYSTSPMILAASLYVCSSRSHFSRSFLTPSSSYKSSSNKDSL